MKFKVPRCSICFDHLSKDISDLTCGHIFHTKCITSSYESGNRVCPLCRAKFTHKHIHHIQLNLCETRKLEKIPGLTAEDESNTDKLKSLLLQSLNESKSAKEKVSELQTCLQEKDSKLKDSESEINSLLSKNRNLKSDKSDVELKYSKEKEEKEKYYSLFSKDHEKLLKAQDKLKELESLNSLVEEIKNQHSSVIWAEEARKTLPIEDQASQFYSALIMSTCSLKSLEVEYKQLKDQLKVLNEEVQRLKKNNLVLTKDSEKRKVGSEFSEVPSNGKRNHEQAGIEFRTLQKDSKGGLENMDFVIRPQGNFNGPKKTLSLLSKRTN